MDPSSRKAETKEDFRREDVSSSGELEEAGAGEAGAGTDETDTGGTETTGAVSVVVEAPKDPRPTMKKKKKRPAGYGSKKNPYMQQKTIEYDLEEMDKKLDDVLKGLDGL